MADWSKIEAFVNYLNSPEVQEVFQAIKEIRDSEYRNMNYTKTHFGVEVAGELMKVNVPAEAVGGMLRLILTEDPSFEDDVYDIIEEVRLDREEEEEDW